MNVLWGVGLDGNLGCYLRDHIECYPNAFIDSTIMVAILLYNLGLESIFISIQHVDIVNLLMHEISKISEIKNVEK